MQHSSVINQIAVDEEGDYIASCSDDRKVFIIGLFSVRYNNVTHYEKPVKVSLSSVLVCIVLGWKLALIAIPE